MKENTLLLQKSLSKVLPNKTALTIVELLFLLLMGMLAVTLHAKLRIPMQLPGKHGILFMFILFTSCSMSSFRYSAMIFSAGASALLLTNLLGYTDPFIGVTYLFIGLSIDIFKNTFKNYNHTLLFILLVAGFSYALIPLSRIIITLATGYPYHSLFSGFTKPFLLHFIFGSIGGAIAYGTQKLIAKKSQRTTDN